MPRHQREGEGSSRSSGAPGRCVIGKLPTSAALPGARYIQPLAQGELDGLCGLYCIINAVRLVIAPSRFLTHLEARSLFEAGLRFLEAKDALLTASHACVGRTVWRTLSDEVVTKAAQLTELEIVTERLLRGARTTTPRLVLNAIEHLIVAGKAPMLFMRGSYRHYSIAAAYTPHSLRLFDSYGYKRVMRSSFEAATNKGSLHRFHVQSLIAVALR